MCISYLLAGLNRDDFVFAMIGKKGLRKRLSILICIKLIEQSRGVGILPPLHHDQYWSIERPQILFC
jgi:hypothetical protein